jgi:hypothetical protein
LSWCRVVSQWLPSQASHNLANTPRQTHLGKHTSANTTWQTQLSSAQFRLNSATQPKSSWVIKKMSRVTHCLELIEMLQYSCQVHFFIHSFVLLINWIKLAPVWRRCLKESETWLQLYYTQDDIFTYFKSHLPSLKLWYGIKWLLKNSDSCSWWGSLTNQSEGLLMCDRMAIYRQRNTYICCGNYLNGL